MNVPLLDLKPQLEELRTDIVESVTKVIDSTCYILGPEVTNFEKEIADYASTTHAVGVSSGTDALLASLMSLDIGFGDKVITTPYSFFATMGTILRVGATPVFADIKPDSYNIDPEQVAEILEHAKKNNDQVKAILPVHLYGQCADMGSLNDLSSQYDVPIIEDAAQAIGAEYPMIAEGSSDIEWLKAGSMGLSGCFSFFPSKNLGCLGDGGVVTTSSEEFAAVLKQNRNHGAEPKYYHARVGGNFRIDALQAAVLSVKLKHLEKWHKQRRANAAQYMQLFQEHGLTDNPVGLPKALYLQHQGADQHNYHIYNQFIISVPQRDSLRDYLLENNIGCEIYYPLCLHQQECVQSLAEVAGKSFPVAEEAARTTLALPIYPELTQDQLSYVVETISKFYKAN